MEKIDIEKIKKVAIDAVFAAGTELAQRYDKYSRADFKLKSFHEIVTAADVASEKIILGAIKKNFPTHRILSEEAGANKKQSDFLWVVDPLDGTHNFSMHNPLWAVSVALFYDEEPVLGLIFAPLLGEFYFAETGGGAYVNGKQLKVSKIDHDNAINTFCHGSKIADIKKALKYCSYQKLNNFDARQLGSAALEMAYVASGRVESLFIPGVHAWDVAAGVLMVREAGGVVTDFKNKFWTTKSKDILASNGVIHANILQTIKKIKI